MTKTPTKVRNPISLQGTRYEGASNWAWIGLEKVNKTAARPTGADKLVWSEEDWVWADGTTLDPSSYGNWMTVSIPGFKFYLNA